MAEANIDNIGKAFCQYYYNLFDSDRTQLASLYQAGSMLTFEGGEFLGQELIMQKLLSLKFSSAHSVKWIDCQPAGGKNIIVTVSGEMIIDGDKDRPVKFNQVFHLVPLKENGSNYWVHNDIFRLNYC